MATKFKFFALGVIASVMGAYLIWPEIFGVCKTYSTVTMGDICHSPLSYPYGVSILPLSISFLGASLIGLLVSLVIYNIWLKFTFGYGVMAGLFLWYIYSIEQEGGFFQMTLLPDLKGSAYLLAILYLFISVVIFTFGTLLKKGKKTANS